MDQMVIGQTVIGQTVIGQTVKFRYSERKFIGFTPCDKYAVFIFPPKDADTGYMLVSKQHFNDYVLTKKVENIYEKITLTMLGGGVDIQTVIDAFISDKNAIMRVGATYVDECVGAVFGIDQGNYSFIKIWSPQLCPY